jgi:hypothetical protein
MDIRTFGQQDGATRNEDGGNMLPAPRDTAQWTYANGAGLANLTGTYMGLPNGAYIELSASTAIGRFSGYVPCRPGEQLFFSYFIGSNYSSGASTESVNASVAFTLTDGSTTAINLSDPPYGSKRTLLQCYGGIQVIVPFTVPINAVSCMPYIERPVFSSFSFYANSAYLGRTEPGGDNTARNQVVVTVADIDIAAASDGTITTPLPKVVATAQVQQGGVDVRLLTTTVFALSNLSPNLTPGDVTKLTISNASGTRGQITLLSGITGSGTADLTVTVSGKTQAPIKVIVNVNRAIATTTGVGSGGAGAGTKTASGVPTGYVSTATFQSAFIATGIVVASGETVRLNASAEYTFYPDSTDDAVRRSGLNGKWQYRIGAGAWADITAATNGTQGGWNGMIGENFQGSITHNYSAAGTAGTYDFQFVVGRFNTTHPGVVVIDSGSCSVSSAV